MSRHTPAYRLRGLTLIELMVALVISLIVILAAAMSFSGASRGFSTVDAASQLRDSTRFAADLIERVGVQAGYTDVFVAAAPPSTDPARDPVVSGFNNALIDATNPLTASSARSPGVDGYGSDILILRYQAAQLHTLYNGTDTTSGGVADQTMIDCSGKALTTVPDPASTDVVQATLARTLRVASIFHVAINQGEPSLMCTYSDTGAAPFVTVPIVQGVENFQVLYGVDGVSPGVAPAANATPPNVPLSFLRADQMVVQGNADGTAANWRRVRSIRVGLVLRGPVGSAVDFAVPAIQTFFPFGMAPSSGSGAAGSAFASGSDTNTTFQPPKDQRLRHTASFTIHLRNDQEQ